MNDTLKKIILIILLPALSWLFFNTVYYRHLHQLSSGINISHAHPYNKTNECTSDPFASHNHTEDEYILYDIISNTILFTLIAVFISLLVFNNLVTDYIIHEEKLQFQELYLLQKYRGPPSIF